MSEMREQNNVYKIELDKLKAKLQSMPTAIEINRANLLNDQDININKNN